MRKFFHWNQANSCLTVETSKQPWYGFGMTIGSGHFQIWLGFYFQLYLSLETNWTRKLWRKGIETEFKIMFSFAQTPSLSYSLFTNPDMNTKFSWRHNYVNLADLFFGRAKYSEEVIDIGTTEVIMPEKRYQAFYKVKMIYWKRPLWPFKTSQKGIEIEVPGGMPFEDEGVQRAMDKFAMSILKERQKNHSLDWKPKE